MEFWIKMQKKNHGHNSTQSSCTKKCFVFKRRLIKISVGRPMSHLRSINLKGRSHPKKPPNPVTNFEAAAANSHWQWLNELGNSRVQKMSQWTSWFDCWARANHSTWHLWIPKQNISSAYQNSKQLSLCCLPLVSKIRLVQSLFSLLGHLMLWWMLIFWVANAKI